MVPKHIYDDLNNILKRITGKKTQKREGQKGVISHVTIKNMHSMLKSIKNHYADIFTLQENPRKRSTKRERKLT